MSCIIRIAVSDLSECAMNDVNSTCMRYVVTSKLIKYSIKLRCVSYICAFIKATIAA